LFFKNTSDAVFFYKKFDSSSSSTQVDKLNNLGAQQELFIAENGFGILKSLFIAELNFGNNKKK
jgi:hypothetical protein